MIPTLAVPAKNSKNVAIRSMVKPEVCSLFKKVIRYLATAFFVLVIVIGTLFIKQPVEFPEREVKLGYPIHFWTLDFSGNRGGTSISGAPDSFLKDTKFNVLSGWEEYIEVSWRNFALSYLIIFFIIEGLFLAIGRKKSPIRNVGNLVSSNFF